MTASDVKPETCADCGLPVVPADAPLDAVQTIAGCIEPGGELCLRRVIEGLNGALAKRDADLSQILAAEHGLSPDRYAAPGAALQEVRNILADRRLFLAQRDARLDLAVLRLHGVLTHEEAAGPKLAEEAILRLRVSYESALRTINQLQRATTLPPHIERPCPNCGLSLDLNPQGSFCRQTHSVECDRRALAATRAALVYYTRVRP